MKKQFEILNRDLLFFLVSFIGQIILVFACTFISVAENPKTSLKYITQESEKELWLSKWSTDNIGRGVLESGVKYDSMHFNTETFVILMNKNDEYLVNGRKQSKEGLKSILSIYLLNGKKDGDANPLFVEKEIFSIGKYLVPNCHITFQNDIESSKDAVNYTLRKIGEAYLEVREAKSFILFGVNYFNLDEEKQKAVNQIVPIRFTYNYPRNSNTSVWLPFDGRPSPKPEPMEMLLRFDGSIHFGNLECPDIDELKEYLQAWKKDLNELNKKSGLKHYYRVYLKVENESKYNQVCSETISNILVVLGRESMHLEKITHVFADEKVIMPLEMNKLRKRTN